MLLSTAYFPPIEYFAVIAAEYSFCEIYVEACETYSKQSYRNRFCFLAGDGKQYLNVPVIHEGGTHNLPITSIKPDYSTPWVTHTERALDSAYMSSPFFEYYRDDIFAILDSHPETLWELDSRLTEYFLRMFGIPAELIPTTSFTPADSGIYGRDLREAIHPKRPNTILRDLGLGKPYYQVFSGKYGFTPGLSALDLLANEGPGSICFLSARTSSQR